jgi:sarcosine oxidase
LVFDRAILCAGPGMRPLIADLQFPLSLVVSKEQASYLGVNDPTAFSPGRFPICIRHSDSSRLSSIFPIIESAGVKMMIERKSVIDDEDDFSVDAQNERQVLSEALSIMDGLAGNILSTETCRYTLTKDEDFIIDRHPQHEQIAICSACSGHGFKFAPAIGELILDLVEDCPLPQPLKALFSHNRRTLN